MRRRVAEVFLRIATGAAAPTEEKITYLSELLPPPGSSMKMAQAKIDAFRSSVKADAISVAENLRIQGKDDLADKIEANIEKLFSVTSKVSPTPSNPGKDIFDKVQSGAVKMGDLSPQDRQALKDHLLKVKQ
jgi:hypothetical protein